MKNGSREDNANTNQTYTRVDNLVLLGKIRRQLYSEFGSIVDADAQIFYYVLVHTDEQVRVLDRAEHVHIVLRGLFNDEAAGICRVHSVRTQKIKRDKGSCFIQNAWRAEGTFFNTLWLSLLD